MSPLPPPPLPAEEDVADEGFYQTPSALPMPEPPPPPVVGQSSIPQDHIEKGWFVNSLYTQSTWVHLFNAVSTQ